MGEKAPKISSGSLVGISSHLVKNVCRRVRQNQPVRVGREMPRPSVVEAVASCCSSSMSLS
jgi:hypothetical protein